jgi:hypothetical protein
MMEFAMQYWSAIDEITGNKVANLRQYELNDDEWRIAQQLCDMLKVSVHPFLEIISHAHNYIRSSKMRHCFSLVPRLTLQL